MNAVNEQEPVSPQHAVLLLVDEQEGLFDRIHQPEQTRSTLVALARCARLLGIPAVMTTALAAGPNGPQLQELTETFAGQEVIDRTLVNAWHDRRARDAVVATGTVRRKLLIAGTGLDVCAQLPALAWRRRRLPALCGGRRLRSLRVPAVGRHDQPPDPGGRRPGQHQGGRPGGDGRHRPSQGQGDLRHPASRSGHGRCPWE